MKRKIIYLVSFLVLVYCSGTISACNEQINYSFSFTINSEVDWHLTRVDIEAAWAISKGSSEIIVAVIDCGINFSHSELTACQWQNIAEIANNSIDDDNNGYVDDVFGWDFVDNDNNPEASYTHLSKNKHGTFIAGVIAAAKGNGGVVGVAPNIKIMNLKVWYDATADDDDEEWATKAEIAEAINYAVENGADVINMSFSYKKRLFTKLSDVEFYDEMEVAVESGTVLVASAGNYDNSKLRYPACFDFVIGVGAINHLDEKASYSSYGKDLVEFVAPGGDSGLPEHQINSTNVNGGYITSYGTSYAAPIVAGIVALMKSVDNTLSPTLIRRILKETAIDLGSRGRDKYFGYGLVNAGDAVDIAQTAATSKYLVSFSIPLSVISFLTTIILTRRRKRRDA